jgi:hypothetical protein
MGNKSNSRKGYFHLQLRVEKGKKKKMLKGRKQSLEEV